jgi:N-methylhydantoinase A
VKVPVVDIVEIGAGGGSIAWLDPAGALKVGPQSAGADPGPASYDWGGTEPTLTDANVVAGRINPDYFLGGRLALDLAQARTALEPIAEALEVAVEEAALGVIRIANANMIHLLKLVSVRRGRDPREFAIVAFGGGGSMHASALARDLHVPRTIVPPAPGHFSAWGMLASDLRHDVVQTRFARSDQLETGELDAVWTELEQRLLATFAEEGLDRAQVTFARSADMRYAGQEHAVNVPIPADGDRAGIEQRFHDLHEQLYTFGLGSPIEFVNFRVTGYGAVRKPELARISANGDAAAALKGARDVDFDELGRREARIYERELLGAGAELEGPAVVEEPAASTVVFPGQRLRVDEYGSMIIDTEAV